MSSEETRSLGFFERVPIIGDAGDPEYAGVLLPLAFTVTIALLIFGGTSGAYSHILQTAGGVVVLIGLYFTGINLR